MRIETFPGIIIRKNYLKLKLLALIINLNEYFVTVADLSKHKNSHKRDC